MRRMWSFILAALALVALPAGAETAKTTLRIEGMTCGGCVPAVKVQFKQTAGVQAYEVSLREARGCRQLRPG